MYSLSVLFFFFQAEDGIRDVAVTGVQTCALPICGRALRHQGQRALSVACRAVSICRGNAWGQENPGLSGLNLESPDRENAGPCFAKKFEAAKTHRMSCRARTAETVEPVYSSASNAYPATRPAPCATHPSAKLIASCTPVVRIAMADCVRPIKCLGTIDIREDCATTPPSARQNPKIICITTAPTRKATKGVAICPAAKTAQAATYSGMRLAPGSWLASKPPQIAPVAQPASKNPSPRDRKSTRLNSSHGYISYAVFCLKKHN